MIKRKEKIEDPLKLLLPGAIYDYFELVHTEVSEVDVHLFLDEQHIPPKAVGYVSKGFTEQSIIQDFPLRGKPVFRLCRKFRWRTKILYTPSLRGIAFCSGSDTLWGLCNSAAIYHCQRPA